MGPTAGRGSCRLRSVLLCCNTTGSPGDPKCSVRGEKMLPDPLSRLWGKTSGRPQGCSGPSAEAGQRPLWGLRSGMPLHSCEVARNPSWAPGRQAAELPPIWLRAVEAAPPGPPDTFSQKEKRRQQVPVSLDSTEELPGLRSEARPSRPPAAAACLHSPRLQRSPEPRAQAPCASPSTQHCTPRAQPAQLCEGG